MHNQYIPNDFQKRDEIFGLASKSLKAICHAVAGKCLHQNSHVLKNYVESLMFVWVRVQQSAVLEVEPGSFLQKLLSDAGSQRSSISWV